MREKSAKAIYYGWYILGAVFFIRVLSAAMRQSSGVFFLPILEDLKVSHAILSLPVALSLILFGASQPIGGLLINRFGSRAIISLGAILTGAAVFGMSQIHSIWGVYFSYGLLLGAGGVGISATAITPLLCRWFVERRGLALSIAATGSSISQAVAIPGLSLLVISLGWRATFYWTGAGFLLLILPIILLVIKNRPEDIGLTSAAEGGRKKDGPARVVPYDLHWVQCLHKKPFILLLTSFFTCGFTVTVIAVHWIPFATHLGFSPLLAATAFGVGGALNTVGVMIAGPLSDRYGRKVPLSLIYLFRSLGFLLFIFFKNDWTVWATPMMIGLSWVATVPLTSALTGDFFGAKNVGVLLGLISFSHQLGSGLSAWLSGYIFDVTGSYDLAFWMAAYLCVQAAVIVYFINEEETRAAPPAAEPATA